MQAVNLYSFAASLLDYASLNLYKYFLGMIAGGTVVFEAYNKCASS